MAGLKPGENASAQIRHHRVRKNNDHLQQIISVTNDLCDPFSSDMKEQPLVNLASGKSARSATSKYLLETLERGKGAREKFTEDWSKDFRKFLKPVKRIKVQNFAAESVKTKSHSLLSKQNNEGLRDVFIRLLVVIAKQSTLDLPRLLSFPIT